MTILLTLANTENWSRGGGGKSGREIHYLTETKLVHVGVVSGQSIFDLFFSVSFREILFVDRTFKLSTVPAFHRTGSGTMTEQ